ncbi:DUF4437 domain-containing protein [Labilibacter marinus]|uniref:DUF4437 domain-containing protein n=1 Tax=Labilibacter marinus TaxID=1477105 RepID=UPI000B12CA88|nr:DUF4437 domain-containing protein [Labilibacter marinus]
MKNLMYLALISILAACNTTPNSSEKKETPFKQDASYEVVLKSEVDWTYLNPKRGDLAPMAGTLWGDRNGTEATGFLLKPSDGFSSPPHIHNVSYRGIVMSGMIHNDDPNAADMWMPAGSFWTQPKGHVHITAAKGTNTFAYIEIDKGPYLVLPADEHFDSGERPVNVDHTNLVWLNASDIRWVKPSNDSANGTKVAFLWGNTKAGALGGTMVKLPAGFNGELVSYDAVLRSVVVQGNIQHQVPGEEKIKDLETGSYFGSKGTGIHKLSNPNNTEAVIYIRTDGNYEIKNS